MRCESLNSSSDEQDYSEKKKGKKKSRLLGVFGKRAQVTKDFQEVEKTKEYAEITYEGMKNSDDSRYLIGRSAFWAEVAAHFAAGKTSAFISDKFMYLGGKTQFTLAACFLPDNKIFQCDTLFAGDLHHSING